MKALALSILLAAVSVFSLRAGEHEIYGPQGKLSYKVSLPKGFDTGNDSCSMVILMHGIFSSKDYNPRPAIAKGLAKAGIASIRFDFGGHGRSEGSKEQMTIEKEIAEAMAIYE